MIEIYDEGDRIEYTKGDAFDMDVTADDGNENTTLRFIISLDETSEPIIDTEFSYIGNQYTLRLTPAEIARLEIGNYIFKMMLISGNNKITQISGDFIVKWGA